MDDPDWLCQDCYDSEPEERTIVVHCRSEQFDVYIGRPSHWGNPFIIGKDGTRREVIAKYRAWILDQPELLARLHELRGKRLGCWCAPKGGLPGNLHGTTCHGEVLAALADESGLGEAIHRHTETDYEQVSVAEGERSEASPASGDPPPSRSEEGKAEEPTYVVGDREYRGEEAEDLRELDRFWYWAAERPQG